ncbi:hypothetical protein SAMN00790413_04558 [Deinococcus hopiensis KR-140]|uniref:UmuC domain-containing protein n=1 Tax=Deinococcus hopiensis KR-140 TaxID=695939 RepID=A0A1W1UJX3_9DEIO|nr:hypothetical protein SAMN00790413_04558 [Deinococcus hopiensis KR-140]
MFFPPGRVHLSFLIFFPSPVTLVWLMRKIVHVDADAFFAGVELRDNPGKQNSRREIACYTR